MKKNLFESEVNKDIYKSIKCLTTEGREVFTDFCEDEFLNWLRNITEYENIEEYLIEYLNQHEYHACYIEGETYCEILDELSPELINKVKEKIIELKFNI